MEVRLDLPADERLDQIVAHLPLVLHQIDDREPDAGGVQRVQISARRLAIAGRVEDVAVVPEAQFVHAGSPRMSGGAVTRRTRPGATASIRSHTSVASSVRRHFR